MSKSARRQKAMVEEDSDTETVQGTVDSGIIPIEELVNQGIAAADVGKLANSGIVTVLGVLMTTRKDLIAIKGLTEPRVEKIIAASNAVMGDSFRTGMDQLATRQTVMHITTGATEVDSILAGGLETRALTEVYGEFRTGKTQLCHTLCVTTMLPEGQGGAAGRVMYIDTEGTFRPERLEPIATRFGLDPQSVLENVVYARAYTHEQQMAIVNEMSTMLKDGSFRLVIIDSVTSLFRAEFSGRGELAERQQRLNVMLSRLVKLAEEFNISVLLTNQVMAVPDAMFACGPKPAGGHILAHASTIRIYLRRGRGGTRVAKVVDAPNLAEAEGSYMLTEAGIGDV